ncbi:MAG: 2,3-bisphosphoglycerate-independent phosphoglycerate mutase [Paracoccaceae bacterium]
MSKSFVLCILDGWGLSDQDHGNAPRLAETPVMDGLMQTCPNATLITHGPDVGLPKGQMGNSEVGHTNIGAGRVVAMDLGQIDLAIEDGSFFEHAAVLEFASKLKSTGGSAHLMGVMSDGGVHGSLAHMIAAATALRQQNVPVILHLITDGRDVAPKSANEYLTQLLTALPGGVKIATLSGRYYVMDRDNRWDRVKTAFDAIVHGQGPTADSTRVIVADAYNRGETDEFIPATVLGGYTGVKDGDGMFCLNFRADRAREILAAMAQPDFEAFNPGKRPVWGALLGMAEYSDSHSHWFETVYPKPKIANTLGAWVAAQGKTQFRLAETEKYPHVTFFLNGGEEAANVGEDRFMPASPKVATYDLQPEMSCAEVTDRLVGAIEHGYDLIVTNYANPDMVGHTGDLDAAMAACAAVDQGLGRVVDAVRAAGGTLLITADHGNCEVMIDPETGGPHTAHTLNLVPVILVNGPTGAGLRAGRLADLAPTLLELMGLDQPKDMTGQSLLV